MSEVNASDTRLINGIEDVIGTYQGAGKDTKTGVEVELAYFDPNSPDLTPMTIPQNKVVKNATNNKCGHDYARNEPTSEMLEIGSIPGTAADLKAIMKDTQDKIECLTKQANDIGLKRSYFQHLPDKSASDLLANVMDVERYQAFFAPPRDDMKGFAAYFSVCKSNQISVSYTDPNHMLKNVRRLYTLAPFLFIATDNNAPFNEGRAFKNHAGMHHRATLGDRGGIPPYVFTAKTGEDYIAAHIDNVLNNPLFVYYNEKGELIRLPSGEWTSFNALKDQGLNTATNYFFSESVLWPDVKIAALKDDDGQVVNHRYEARMLGVGLHQHQTALLVVAALAFDQDFASKVDALLAKHGLPQNDLQTLKAALESAYKAALTHNGQFMDVPYGNASMLKFARAFAELMQDSTLLKSFPQEIEPLLSICQTGCTDSKVNAALFQTLENAMDFQRNYDQTIFEDPTLNALKLFKDDLKDECEHAKNLFL